MLPAAQAYIDTLRTLVHMAACTVVSSCVSPCTVSLQVDAALARCETPNVRNMPWECDHERLFACVGHQKTPNELPCQSAG